MSGRLSMMIDWKVKSYRGLCRSELNQLRGVALELTLLGNAIARKLEKKYRSQAFREIIFEQSGGFGI